METVISTEKLTKRFGAFVAVNEITFDVRPAEIFGFLGANGAGKTTAMRMLCGLLKPSGGAAMVAGFDVNTQAGMVKQHIGYMSQRFSLYEDLTIAENFRFYGGIYKLKKNDVLERLDEMLNRFNLAAEKNSLVGALPLGWKQKLAFSLALLHRPEIIFLDEPTGGVDPITRRQFWELIYAAAADNITIFVTTHYMDEAEYCNRLSIMVDGAIKALDSPANLREQFGADSMDTVFQMLVRGH
jgi:ABC-2 type transport system ATP-binding protein